jgi:hypothetical protein
MNDSRITPEVDSLRRLRAQRREAGLVAQYIHELSERHAGARHTGHGGLPHPTSGAHQPADAEGG